MWVSVLRKRMYGFVSNGIGVIRRGQASANLPKTRGFFGVRVSRVGTMVGKARSFSLPSVQVNSATGVKMVIAQPQTVAREIGDVVEDFELIRDEYVKEYASQARLWKHRKTGTEMLSLLNADENKTFGIAFRTTPSDSTGVPHILEHSVLCGSKKYPVKEPFVELIKSSLNTFLNAFTFPDKTCYPVASCNEQDFYNLVDVYLDAVLHPNINPDTLRQEGHHFELDDINGKMTIKGVVYNEMKGAYSEAERVLAGYSQQALFPDNTYGIESGGHPRDIPDLTWDQFKNFYDTYYHPSNARVWFYGDDNEEKRLSKVNEFLKDFEQIDVTKSRVQLQEKWTEPRQVEHTYDCGDDGDPAKKYMTTSNWLLPAMDSAAPVEILALTVLSQLLLSTSASPLRKALIDSGLGDDIVGGGLETDLRQMSFSIGMKGLSEDGVDKVNLLIEETLKKIAAEGVPKSLLDSCLNTLEFRLRENNTGRFPRGLSMMISSLSTWLHEADPLVPLRFEKPLEDLKARLANGEKVFENLIEEYLLNNTHRATVVMIPDTEYSKKEEALEQKRIDAMAKAASKQELEEIVEMTKRLREQQAAPDKPEDLAKIPCLKKSDLEPETKTVPFETEELSGVTVYHHPLATSGIAYVDIVFDLNNVSASLLPLLSLYTDSLTQMGTKKEDFVSLQQRIGRETGGIRLSTYTSQMVSADGKGPVVSFLTIRAKGMATQTPQLFDLLKDIVLEPNFDNKERFRQLLTEEKAGVSSSVIPSGHTVAAGRLRAQYRAADWSTEQMGGLEYITYLKTLLDRVDNDWESVLAELELLHQTIFNQQAMTSNVTVDSDAYGKVRPNLSGFIEALPKTPATTLKSWIYEVPTLIPKNEGFTIPAQVNYVGKAMNLLDSGFQLTGASALAAKHLGTSHLWDTVRVQGGAYGGFCRLDMRSGTFLYLSYRDPNVNKTLANYDDSGAFLRKNALSEEDLTKSVIGMIGEVDSYSLPDSKGFASLIRKLTNETDDIRQQRREEILGATPKDLKDFGEALEATKDKGSIVVVGGETALKAAKEEGLDLPISPALI